MSTRLVIKNMVCPRCIMSVEDILRRHGWQPSSVRLGEVELPGKPGKRQLQELAADLEKVGFELLDDQRMQLIEQIKVLLINKVQQGDIGEHFSVVKYLSDHLYRDYSSLSKLFSEVEGITIEKYFINLKIEKVKELIMYDQMSLTGIAASLGYSSVAHLSAQFKKVTGLTPSHFKKPGQRIRSGLDNLK
ncbi:MAG TPA: AraC family transcriptional regulator [Chitinophagaceae bacterium]|nr:AraC family transcriptional regulator [Chitinophagaceae bacterium]